MFIIKKSIYIFSKGILKRKDNTISFENDKGRKIVPVENISDIFIFGEADINKKLLELLSQKNILLHYYNYYDYYMGTFYPREHLNSGHILLQQAKHYLDSDKRMRIASKICDGAIKNIIQILNYYNNRGKNIAAEKDSIIRLNNKINECTDTAQLMSIEGNIREYYYKAFDKIIDNSAFRFEKRSKRPPRNELNSLISFCNSLLYNIILSEIYKTHLDPRIGYLHTTNYRRFSLNLDISEIFKPIIVDRMIFKLLSKKMITKKDFDSKIESVLIKDKGRETIVKELDNRLNSTIKVRELNKQVSYRYLIRLELYKVEKHLLEEKEYKAYVSKW